MELLIVGVIQVCTLFVGVVLGWCLRTSALLDELKQEQHRRLSYFAMEFEDFEHEDGSETTR